MLEKKMLNVSLIVNIGTIILWILCYIKQYIQYYNKIRALFFS